MAAVELASTSLFSDGNLVAYYKLEDLTDSKGSRTLTNNSSASNVAAKFNNGFQMTLAAGNFLNRTTDNYGIAGNGDLGISLWYRVDTAPSSGQTYGISMFRSQLTLDRYIALSYRNNSGTKQFLIDNSGTTTTYDTDLGTATFFNIILSRAGTSSCKLFLNAVDVGVTAAQGSSTAGSANFNISSDGANSGTHTIDDVSIFSRQLVQADANTINGIASSSNSSFFHFM